MIGTQWNHLCLAGLLLAGLLTATACSTAADLLPGQPASADVTLPHTSTPLPSPTPISEDAGGTGRAFYRAWEGDDYLGMYSLLSPQSQAIIDSGSFVNRYEEAMETAAVQVVHAQPLSLLQEGSEAAFVSRVAWETAVVGDVIRDHDMRLVFDGGRWGVDWNESLILPELAGGNRLSMEYRIPARGNIYDIDGRALAYQGNAFELGVIPGQIADEAGLLSTLSTVLNEPAGDIRDKYSEALPDWYVPVGEVSETILQENILALEPYFGAGLTPPERRPARLYTDEGTAPHIIGYQGVISAEEEADYLAQGYRGDETVGLAGLEAWGEEYLNGERGGRLSVITPQGEVVEVLQEREPKVARSIYTTLDMEFQAGVERALAEVIESYPATDKGAIVVLDVNTGAVRAMATYPSYDPRIFDALRSDGGAALSAVLNDPRQPLVNRATQGAYPAGSTFKIVTLSAALNSGLYTADSRYTSTGIWNRLGDAYAKTDWLAGGHGTISLRHALVVSCNSCFYDVGYTLDGSDNTLLPRVAREFGLGTPTGIQGVAESPGLIPDPEWKLANIGDGWATGDAVNMAIGQGYVQVTPLQMASIVAAVANGGKLMQPQLIDRIGAGGGAPEEKLPQSTNNLLPLSAEQIGVLRESLYNVAHSGSGTATHRFQNLPVSVAGKTGTAEAPPGLSHAWFVGYAPADPYTTADGRVIDSPEIAIAVVLEHAGEGSVVAAPLFRRVVERYYSIEPEAPYPWGG